MKCGFSDFYEYLRIDCFPLLSANLRRHFCAQLLRGRKKNPLFYFRFFIFDFFFFSFAVNFGTDLRLFVENMAVIWFFFGVVSVLLYN